MPNMDFIGIMEQAAENIKHIQPRAPGSDLAAPENLSKPPEAHAEPAPEPALVSESGQEPPQINAASEQEPAQEPEIVPEPEPVPQAESAQEPDAPAVPASEPEPEPVPQAESAQEPDAPAVPASEPEPQVQPPEQTNEPDDEIPDGGEEAPSFDQTDEAAKVPKRGRGRPRKGSSPSEGIQIVGFPRSVMQAVRQAIPAATNNADALAAFCYIKLGAGAKVSREIEELAASYNGDRSDEKVARDLSSVIRDIADMKEMLMSAELGVAYLTYARAGYEDADRVSAVTENPKDFNFLTGRMDSLLQGMRSTARDRLKYEADRRGREIYKARANKRNL